MKDSNNNKLMVVKQNVKKTFNDGTKLIVKSTSKLNKIKIGGINGLHILGLVLLILVLFLGFNIFSSPSLDYPVVYNNNEGDLYLMGVKVESQEDGVKLAKNESASNVVYANESDRYVLFQKEQKLYLYDSKNKEQTEKIMDDVIQFQFTEDDKFVIALDRDKNLNVYNFKETIKIESDVAEILAVSNSKIVYDKEGKIYVRSINPKKDDRNKITEDYDNSLTFSKDESKVLYITEEKDLYVYNVKKEKNEKIDSNVLSYYCDNNACEKMFYVENEDGKTIEYYDGKKSTKVASDIYNVNASDTDEKKIVYSTLKDGKYSLYYQVVGKEEALIEDNLSSIRTVRIFKGKEIYYITGKNVARYVKINGDKIGKVADLASDVTGYFQVYKNGYAFVGDVSKKSNGNLYMVKNGKVKKIDDTVNSNTLTVNKAGNKIYYLKDYETTGTLYVTDGGKGKKIDDDVYTLEYVNDNLIYYIKDYSTSKSRGDLYRYTGKSVKIAENVTRVANVPVVFTLD